MSSRFDYSQWMITPTNNRMKWFHSNRNNHICHFSNHLLNVVNVKPSARFHFFIPFFFLFLRLNVICTQKAAIRPHLFLRIIEGKKSEMRWRQTIWKWWICGPFFCEIYFLRVLFFHPPQPFYECTVNFVRQIKIRAIENGNANINIGFQGIWK